MHIVLLEPEIPQNAGNIARTCAVTNSTLHLIRPLGFSVDDRYLKRAGLDYWKLLDIRYYDDFQDFRQCEFRRRPVYKCQINTSSVWICPRRFRPSAHAPCRGAAAVSRDPKPLRPGTAFQYPSFPIRIRMRAVSFPVSPLPQSSFPDFHSPHFHHASFYRRTHSEEAPTVRTFFHSQKLYAITIRYYSPS